MSLILIGRGNSSPGVRAVVVLPVKSWQGQDLSVIFLRFMQASRKFDEPQAVKTRDL